MPAKEKATAPASNASIPADAEFFDVPSASDLPRCPACKIGLLYPIALDEAATHEDQVATKEGDPTSHDHFVASGGAVRLFCFCCQRGSSHPLNPEE